MVVERAALRMRRRRWRANELRSCGGRREHVCSGAGGRLLVAGSAGFSDLARKVLRLPTEYVSYVVTRRTVLVGGRRLLRERGEAGWRSDLVGGRAA